MMVPPYLSLDELLERVDEPYRSAFRRLRDRNTQDFRIARGSTWNHQAWAGGYIDHIQEVMNLGIRLYDCLGQLRPFPFSLSDALIVLFVHDLEKPWAYEEAEGTWRRREGLKENAHAFRLAKLTEVGISLPDELECAVSFVEGEGVHYNNHTRGMSPLAAFCHMCDVASARLWHNHPLERGDPWVGANRSSADPGAADGTFKFPDNADGGARTGRVFGAKRKQLFGRQVMRRGLKPHTPEPAAAAPAFRHPTGIPGTSVAEAGSSIVADTRTDPRSSKIKLEARPIRHPGQPNATRPNDTPRVANPDVGQASRVYAANFDCGRPTGEDP